MRTDHLLVQLRTGSSKKKLEAIKKLPFAKNPPREAIPEFQALLSDSDSDIRMNALFALSLMDGKNVAPFARNLLTDSDPMVRALAALLVSQLGEKHLGYPVLRSLIHSSSEADRRAARIFQPQCEKDFDPDKHCAAELSSKGRNQFGTPQTHRETVSCPLSRSLEVTIAMPSDTDKLSTQQAKAMDMIRQLPKSIVTTIRKEFERRLRLEAEMEDEDEPLALEFRDAAIPLLSVAGPVYFYLSGESDFDPEHGFACLVRNGSDMCVFHHDAMINSLQSSDSTELDALFASETPVRLD